MTIWILGAIILWLYIIGLAFVRTVIIDDLTDDQGWLVLQCIKVNSFWHPLRIYEISDENIKIREEMGRPLIDNRPLGILESHPSIFMWVCSILWPILAPWLLLGRWIIGDHEYYE